MIKTMYPESVLFGNHPDPQLVCDKIKQKEFYVYCIMNGKKCYEFVKFDDREISILFGNVSVVKHGRHWWL